MLYKTDCSDREIEQIYLLRKHEFKEETNMVFEKIQEIIAEQLGRDVSEIQMDTNVEKDLEADSLDLFQIISDIEDEFEVSIEDTDGIQTVGDVVKLVEDAKK